MRFVEQIRKRQKKRLKKSTLISTIVVISVVAVSLILGYQWVIKSYVNENVSDFVKKKLNENKNITAFEFDSLWVDVWNSKIFLHEAYLHTSSTKEITAKTPTLIIDTDNLLRYWLNDEVSVELISLQNPYIEVIETVGVSDSSQVSSSGQASADIINHVDLLKIENLDIENATVRFMMKEEGSSVLVPKFEIDNLSINLEGFRLDSDELLEIETSKLNVTMEDQRITLPDSSLQFQIDRIDYRNDSDELTFKQISVLSLADSVEVLRIPQMRLVGFQLNEGDLEIDSYTVESPAIVWSDSLLRKSDASSKSDSSTHTPILRSVLIKSLHLADGSASGVLSDSLKVAVQSWEVKGSSLEWSSKANEPVSWLDMNVFLHDISVNQADKERMLYVRQLSYENYGNRLTIDSLQFNAGDRAIIQGEIERIRLNNLNHQALFENKLMADELYVRGTDINVNGLPQRNQKGDLTLPLDTLLLEKIRLENVTLSVAEKTNYAGLKNADILFSEVGIAQGQPIWTDWVNTLKFYAPRIYAGSTSSNQKIDLRDTYLTALDSTLIVNEGLFYSPNAQVELESLSIKNGTSLSDFSPDSIRLSHTSLLEYRIDYQTDSQAVRNSARKSQARPFIAIDSIYIRQGSVGIDVKDMRVEASPKALFIKGLTYSDTYKVDDMSLHIRDISFKKEAMEARLKSLEARLLPEETIALNGATMRWEKDADQWAIATVSQVNIKPDNLMALIENQDQIDIATIDVVRPRLSMRQNSDTSSSKSTKKWVNPWPKNAPKVSVGLVRLTDGAFSSISNVDTLKVNGIDVKLGDVALQEDSLLFAKKPSGLLYASEWETTIAKLNYHTLKDRFIFKNATLGEEIVVPHFDHSSDVPGRKMSFGEFKLTGFQANEWIAHKKLKVGRVVLSSPIVQLDILTQHTNESNKPQWKVEAQSFELTNGQLNIGWGSGNSMAIGRLGATLQNIHHSARQKTFKMPVQSMHVSAEAVELATNSGMDVLSLDKVLLADDEWSLVGIAMTPQYEKQAYFEKRGYETDWIQATIPSLHLQKRETSPSLFPDGRALVSSTMSIQDPNVYVYRDKNLENPEPVYKKLPVSLLRSIPVPLRIDSLAIQNANITYEEVPEKGDQPGTISFNEMQAYLGQVTNDPVSNETMDMEVSAVVMEEVPFSASFDFDLTSEQDQFSFTANVSPHDITTFNEFTEYGAFVHVKSGFTKELDLQVNANDTVGYGSMDFKYKNLKIALMDKEDYSTSSVDESIISFIANTFLVNKRNTKLSGYKEGNVYFERIQHKSFFNYLSKLFISGASSSTGFKNYSKEVEEVSDESGIVE